MGDSMASPPAIEDQGRLLEDALGQVRQQTQMMRRLLETPGKLMDALKCRLVNFLYPFRIGFSTRYLLILVYIAQLSFQNCEHNPLALNSITSYIWPSSMR